MTVGRSGARLILKFACGRTGPWDAYCPKHFRSQLNNLFASRLGSRLDHRIRSNDQYALRKKQIVIPTAIAMVAVLINVEGPILPPALNAVPSAEMDLIDTAGR